jgi:hypothetical protein
MTLQKDGLKIYHARLHHEGTTNRGQRGERGRKETETQISGARREGGRKINLSKQKILKQKKETI